MSVSNNWGKERQNPPPKPTQKKPHCIFTSTSSRPFPLGCIPSARDSSRRCHSRGQSQQAALLPPPVGDWAGADRVTKPVCFAGECWQFSQVTRAQDYPQQQRPSRNSTYSSLTQTVNTALISNRDKRRAKAGNCQQMMFYEAGYLESLYADSVPGSSVRRLIQDLFPLPGPWSGCPVLLPLGAHRSVMWTPFLAPASSKPL